MKRHHNKSSLQTLCTLMMAGSLALSPLASLHAGMVGTAELAEAGQVQMQRDDLRQVLARDEVRNYLVSQGVSPDDVQNRIANLSDAELRAFHERLGNLPAGQDFGVVIAVIVILMLLDIAGVTDVFPRL